MRGARREGEVIGGQGSSGGGEGKDLSHGRLGSGAARVLATWSVSPLGAQCVLIPPIQGPGRSSFPPCYQAGGGNSGLLVLVAFSTPFNNHVMFFFIPHHSQNTL